jgi:hypothetical protein
MIVRIVFRRKESIQTSEYLYLRKQRGQVVCVSGISALNQKRKPCIKAPSEKDQCRLTWSSNQHQLHQHIQKDSFQHHLRFLQRRAVGFHSSGRNGSDLLLILLEFVAVLGL